MNNFVYDIPTKVYFGENQLINLGPELKKFGTRVLMTYDFYIEVFLCTNITEKLPIIPIHLSLQNIYGFVEEEKVKYDPRRLLY